MPANNLEYFVLKLTHTGLNKDGGPNLNPVLIPDLDVGYEYQLRKVPVYVPVGGSITLPYTSRSMFSVAQGAVKTFVDQGLITAVTLVENAAGSRPIMNSANTINWDPSASVDNSNGYLTEWPQVVALANSMVGPVNIQILTNPDDDNVGIPANTDSEGNYIPWEFTNPTTLVGRNVNADWQSASGGPDQWAYTQQTNVYTEFGCQLKGLVGLKDLYFESYTGDYTILIDNTYAWSSFFLIDNAEVHRDYEDYYESIFVDECNASIVLRNGASIRWYAVRVDGYATITTDSQNCWIGSYAVAGNGFVDFFVNPGSAYNSSQDVDCDFNRMWIQNVEMHDTDIYDGSMDSTYLYSVNVDTNSTLQYYRADPTDWAGTPPNNIKDAVDRLAEACRAGGHTP